MKVDLRLLRNHLQFIIVVLLLIIITTWPVAPTVLGLGGIDGPPGSGDVFIKFWDAWYVKSLLNGQADYSFTDLSFHPHGVSLAYHNFSIPNMLVFGGLRTFLPTVRAFLLAYLLTVFANATACYIFLLCHFKKSWIALAGGVIFSLSSYFMPHVQHPDNITLVTIPLALYAFHRGMTEHRRAWLIAAGGFAGVTAFIGMYTLVCLVITLAVYTLYLAVTRWRVARFWTLVTLVVLVAASIAFIRIYPMILDLNLLDEALTKGLGQSSSTDLLVFLVNPRHPLTNVILNALFGGAPSHFPPDAYLGLLPLALTLFGLSRASNRRVMAPWLIMLLIFIFLRLGAELQIGGHVFSGLYLPKHYLDMAVPWLTKAFWDRAFFQIGILMPLAVLSCYGLQALLTIIPPERRRLVVISLLCLVAFETYQPPFQANQDYRESYSWIDWLTAEPDQDGIHLINLPMSRQNSKLYLYHQTLHGYPQVEGLAARTPESAYEYIEGNLLLSAWRAGRTLHCLPQNRDAVLAAQQTLIADGFTHIIVHPEKDTSGYLAANFYTLTPAYADELAVVYRVSDLPALCHDAENIARLTLGDEAVSDNWPIPARALPSTKFSVLSLHPADFTIEQVEDLVATEVIANDVQFLLFHQAQPPTSEPTPLDQHHELLQARETSDAILFVYHPRATETDAFNAYHAWLSAHFTDCGRIVDTDATVIEYFLRPGFPCQLALSDSPFAVDYDNGAQLGNLLASVTADMLELHLIWTQLPTSAHAFSVQFFDEAGDRAHNQDFVFHRDALGRYEINLSPLPPGDYSAKLIVYNYDTGASVPGVALTSQTRSQRELEFRRIRIAP